MSHVIPPRLLYTLIIVAVALLLGRELLERSPPSPMPSESTASIEVTAHPERTDSLEPETHTEQLSVNTDQAALATTLEQRLHLAQLLGRNDLIAATQQQLALLVPPHPLALFYEAYLALADGHQDEAAAAQAALAEQPGTALMQRDLQAYIDSHGVNKKHLQRARLLAKTARYAEALAAFEQVFPEGMPTPSLQLEYLQLRGHIKAHRRDTLQRLQTLNNVYPNIPVYQLALAQHRYRGSPNSAEALAAYRGLAHGGDSGLPAAYAWQRALDGAPMSASWLGEYRSLLALYPDNLDFQQRYDGAEQAWLAEQRNLRDPYYRARKRGLQLLERGADSAAEPLLRRALRAYKHDAEVLGGLGYIAMNQDRWDEALNYFRGAVEHNRDPDNTMKWQRLRTEAGFWQALRVAETHIEGGRYLAAERLLRRAATFKPRSPDVAVARAKLALVDQEFGTADRHYRQALRYQPMHTAALRGRVELALRRDGQAAALALIATYTPAQRERIAPQRRQLRIAHGLQRAAVLGSGTAELAVLVDELLGLNPDSPWQRRELAILMGSVGRSAEADGRMARWARADGRAEMHHAYALYLAGREQLTAAIAQLEQVAPSQRSGAMSRSLLSWQFSQAQAGLRNIVDGDQRERALAGLAQRYHGDVDAELAIAQLYLAEGEFAAAEQLYLTAQPQRTWPWRRQIAYGELMLSLAKLADFPAWRDDQPASADVEFTAGLQRLDDDYYFARAQGYEDKDLQVISHALYRRLMARPGEHQFAAQKAVLRHSYQRDVGEFDEQSAMILAQLGSLSSQQLLELTALFEKLEADDALTACLDHLVGRDDLSREQRVDTMQLLAASRRDADAELQALAILDAKVVADSAEFDVEQWYPQAADDWLNSRAKSTLDTLRDRAQGQLIIGMDFSAKGGRDRLWQLPIQLSLPFPKYNGHLILRADTVSIDSGELRYIERDPTAPTQRLTSDVSGRDEGLMLGLGWRGQRWWADIGSTPQGFENASWLGGVGMNGKVANIGWRLSLSQRPQTSTTLAYAGLRVPTAAAQGSNQFWGGVLRSGGKLNLSYDRGGRYGLWSSLQYHNMHGEKVVGNRRAAALAGVYWRIVEQTDRGLRIGVNVSYLNFRKNLGEISLGHGGYYSPQSYLSLSLPVRYFGRHGDRWSYMVGAAISGSRSQLDAPHGLPGNAGRGGGVGYYAEAVLERRLNKRWAVGVAADVHRSEFYQPNHIQLYMKYQFAGGWQPIAMPPEPLGMYAEFD